MVSGHHHEGHITSLSGPRMTTDTNKVSSDANTLIRTGTGPGGCEMLISERSEARLVTFRHPSLIIPVMIY